MALADRLALVLEVVVGTRLREHGARFGQAVADGELAQVHAVDGLAHGLRRAGAAGHNARAQAGQVERLEVGVIQLRNEHGGNAVDRRRTLFMDGLEHQPRVEVLHDNHGGTMGQARHNAEHTAEAMEERDRQRDTVVGRELLAFADVEAIVQDVAVREHDALREARRSGGVLHHDDVVVVELLFRLAQRVVGDVAAQQDELGHAVAATVLLRAHVDDALQEGIFLGLQVAALLRERFRHKVADNLQVIDVAIAVDHAERLHIRLLEHVVQLVAFVHGVDRDHDDADLRRRVHEREPVGNVTRPHAQMVARLQANGQHAARQVVGALVEVFVGPAQVAIGVDDELVIRVDSHLVAEILADGLFGMERVILRARDGLARRLCRRDHVGRQDGNLGFSHKRLLSGRRRLEEPPGCHDEKRSATGEMTPWPKPLHATHRKLAASHTTNREP